MDIGQNHQIQSVIGGISQIHRIRWKTPKVGGTKKPATDKAKQRISADESRIDVSLVVRFEAFKALKFVGQNGRILGPKTLKIREF